METAHLIFRLLALSQVVFICLYLILNKQHQSGGVMLALGICFASYLLQPIVGFDKAFSVIQIVTAMLASSVPIALWLLAHRYFNDDTRVPVWFLVAGSSYLLLWFLGELELLDENNPQLGAFIFQFIPQIVKLGLVLHVIYLAIEGRSRDLVDKRLRLRIPLAISAAIVCAMVILVEVWAARSMPLVIELVGSVFMFVIALSANLTMFQMRQEFPLQPERTETEVATAEEAESLSAIHRIMEEQRFYARHSVTLADLATELTLPIHRLRALINNGLGYQNFNQFLNHYRVQEAADRIAKQRDLPILTIALDVGFKSMSSFNTAFKNIHGYPPSNLRTAPSLKAPSENV